MWPVNRRSVALGHDPQKCIPASERVAHGSYSIRLLTIYIMSFRAITSPIPATVALVPQESRAGGFPNDAFFASFACEILVVYPSVGFLQSVS